MRDSEDRGGRVPEPNQFGPGDEDLDPRLELRSAFSEALTQHGFPDTLVLGRSRAEEVFHERRLELLDYLKENEPRSVRALAEALGYDKGVVSRDLKRLAEVDIVEYVDQGRAKAPRLKHSHVAVEPII